MCSSFVFSLASRKGRCAFAAPAGKARRHTGFSPAMHAGPAGLSWIPAALREAVLLQAIDERAAADAQPARRFRLVAARRRQGLLDLIALEGVEPLPEGLFFRRRAARAVRGACRSRGERARADLAAGAERDQARPRGFQLANVPRPVGEAQLLEQRRREARVFQPEALRVAPGEFVRQRGDVLAVLV